ncbi:MAG: hypothetical protein AB2L24_00080 [Mangrovibacterium sp.]
MKRSTGTEDAHNAVEVGIFNYDFYSFATKWMEDVIESQEPNGHVPPINPTANWGYSKADGMPPDWSGPVVGRGDPGDPVVYLQLLRRYTGSQPLV